MKPGRIRRLFVAGSAGPRGLTDTELLEALITAVAACRLTAPVAGRIVEEAQRLGAAGETGRGLDLGELAHRLYDASVLAQRRKTDDEIRREYAELARERAALRKLTRRDPVSEAAPDMLTALKTLVGPNGITDNYLQGLKLARAAMAKAGEEIN